jgi:hypothetical protein
MSGPVILYAIGAAVAAFGVVGIIASGGRSRLGVPVVEAACALLVTALAWRIVQIAGWLAVAVAALLLCGYAWLARRRGRR